MILAIEEVIKELGKTKKGKYMYLCLSGQDVVKLISSVPVPNEPNIGVEVAILDALNLVFYVRHIAYLNCETVADISKDIEENF